MKWSNRWNHVLGALAVLVWVGASLTTITTIHRPKERESRERVAAFDRRYETEILPTYRTLGVPGTLKVRGFEPNDSTQQRSIHYRVFRRTHFAPDAPELGAIVLSPDVGDLEYQYAELIFDLTRAGYSVYALEHRGGGFSERLLRNRTVAHVDRFLDYSADLKTFVDEIVKPAQHRDLFLLCHSLGCAISAPFLASNPRLFTGVAMSAPAFELKLPATSRVAAFLERHSLLPKNLSIRFAAGQGPYDYDLKFEDNLATGSWMRFHKAREQVLDTEQLAERAARRRIPVALGGGSAHWVAEVVQANQDLLVSELWRSPTLMLQAENDAWSGAPAQAEICQRLADTGCRLQLIPGAYHDLFLERDPIRNSVLSAITSFFQGHSNWLANRAVKPFDS